MSDKRSALDALSAAEKATVLDELLAARTELREPAEAYAVQVMTDADRSAVVGDVEGTLQGLDIEELNTRAGYRRGRGYVHPAEAGDEILDDALQPFLDDLQRRADLGTDPQPSNLRRASCSASTTAATATPRRCWSTPRTTRPSAHQVW